MEELTKEQAIEAMKQGKKIHHYHFSALEWMTIVDGFIVLEDGVKCEPYEFWRWRTDETWNKGYYIFN